MGIFRDMHETRQFASDREYTELRWMLSEAISRGFVEQVPVMKPSRYSPRQEWFRDKETGEIFSLDPPDENVRGLWDKVDPQDLVKPGDTVQ